MIWIMVYNFKITNVYGDSILLSMSSKRRNIIKACQIFDKLPQRGTDEVYSSLSPHLTWVGYDLDFGIEV